MNNIVNKPNVGILVVALAIAIFAFFYVRTAPLEPIDEVDSSRCYDDCFPFVGKLIDDRCYCAYDDRGWTLFGGAVEALPRAEGTETTVPTDN